MIKKVKNVAIIGIGYWGEKIKNSIIKNKKFKLSYIADISMSKRNLILKDKIPNYTKLVLNYKQIDYTNIDAVFIVTPAKTHFKISKFFLERKINVFIEKPITLNIKDYKVLDKISQKNKLVLMAGDLYLYNPAINLIKKKIDNNYFGKIKYIEFNRLNYGIVRSDINLIENLSSHDISILFYIFKNLKIKKIQATKQSILPNKKYDIFQSNITFTNNLKVSLKLSWNYPAKIRNIVIFGTKKNVFFDDLKPHEINISNKIIYNKSGLKSIGKDSKILLKKNTKKPPLDIELDYFYSCLIGKLKPRSNKKLIINTLNLMEKLNKS
tara:strand:- start:10984 stop:11958 length:975 start_codon:yes stop_codon:yes gene_type:complete